ncbi:MAG: CoA-acylating methylmalonate-semialdehyde dehydrogenase [Rhodospirillaceae bacterium]|jgi:malonate-semialdehyde dehydrogenase (acetylating)/methylmalonate-semialdehyde dehydrogenase|nr:CoA-acylating methylmalonate-semialdehyde dehydrogenase [Rhodospirillaceae bacterium]MBT3492745.1 CoA-acylating methylmalonate-semialdehyde dehydrogenase [Rhodospirillaceae bacterium]MBT3779560.1 CoA-acylating methylmalonate-semialdehyde dehydrogenase [Rhodospirillaceae bacterium]MBT3975853.1 CoA-acylating methylmalonate-semialdehyde dehydrogenase [Rhodospirillaceae bacterium]MBT4170373.1 CoA-acylating methylmalonate-semialdehyde dehydrogenase [Rhodospirillaceae bacterium]
MKQLYHFVDGRAVPGESDRFSPVYNASTGEQIFELPLATADEVRAVIASSAKAFPGWANTAPSARARVMFRFKDLLEQNMDELSELCSIEHGKVKSDAAGSITRGLEVVEFACGIPQLLKGEFSANVAAGIDLYSMRQPLGVVAGITPFNFPAMVPMWMFPVAIACGNCFILKPSEKDPSLPLRLAELMMEAGAPEGVLNVVNGDKLAVDTLIEDPNVKAVSFVGSTPIANYVYERCAHFGKRVQAMGGAKNHMIVMPDADMEQAVDALMGAGYGSAGERCMAVSVAVPVGQDTADELVARLKPRIEALKVGPSLDPASEMGPLVTAEHLAKVKGYVDLGVQEGADLVVDGRDFRAQGYENGFFMGGCLFDNVTDDMRIYKEEIFGPVLSVVRAPDFDEALRLPTEHEFGNGVAIFTRDGDAARDFTANVEVGMVGINVPIPVPMAFYSFGGWKNSAFGDMNQHGPDGVRFYTRTKTVTSRWPTGIRAGAEFAMPTPGSE